jgi:DNA-binding IclR family transcriptional regulator
MKPGDFVSIDRALEVLCCFSNERPEWGVSDLAEYLGFYKSTVHRFLANFEQVGLVERTADRRYRLGVRALELGNIFRFSQRLLEIAERPLRELAEETECISRLGRLEGREVVVLLRTSGAHSKAFAPYPASRMPAHCTALGKMLLSAFDEEDLNRFFGTRTVLKELTPSTITSPEALREHLRQVGKAGYAIDDEEAVIGQRCLAVPLRDPERGDLFAAIGISGEREKLDDRLLPDVIKRMKATAKAITAALGRDGGNSSG